MGRLALILLATAWSQCAGAQGLATNDIASCSIIRDPTAQRICIESARQSRPASTFDPTAEKLKRERRAAPRQEALNPRTGNERERARRPDDRSADSPAKPKDWRLQIP
jgi:hypothetical protein